MKKTRKFIKVFVCVFLSLVLLCGMWMYYTASKINNHIIEENVVYIPDKMARRFYHSFGFLDSQNYWIIKPSNADREKIEKDIEKEKWSKPEIQHFNLLNYLGLVEEHRPIQKVLEGEEKYICVYDNNKGTILTNEENLEVSNTSNWVIFIYNVDKNLFCCIWSSM